METQDILTLRLDIQRFMRLFGLLDRHVTPCGFPLSVSQVIALQELENREMTLTELTDRLLLERSSVSRLADQLVKEGFIDREPNRENRREVLLSLAPKGNHALRRVREQSVAFYRRLFDRIPEADQGKIGEAFRLLNLALSQERGERHG